MSAVILYLPYLPNAEWFSHFLKYEYVLIEQEENFVKSTYRNRCEIAGANGRQILSIPVVGGRSHHQKYRDTKVSTEYNWRSNHWQSIRSAYGSAPFYEFYADKLEAFYERKFELLFEQNLALLNLVMPMLKINKSFELTSEYHKTYEDKIDFRSGKSTSALTSFPRYYQVFEERNGFIPNLSILDLISTTDPKRKNI